MWKVDDPGTFYAFLINCFYVLKRGDMFNRGAKNNNLLDRNFDPCPPAGVSTMDFRDTRDLYFSAPAVVTDELTHPSK
jgi:hypothetical protein